MTLGDVFRELLDADAGTLAIAAVAGVLCGLVFLLVGDS